MYHLRVNFTAGSGKLRSITSVGVSANFLLKATVRNVYEYQDGHKERETVDSPYEYEKFGLSPMISTGVSYAFNDHLQLRFEPTARYGVLQLIDAPLTAHLWSVGLNVGAYLTL